jgi:replicative DNA helicase
MLDRLMSIEAEQAILGAFFIKPSALPDMAVSLTPHDFGEPLHQRIYAAMQRMHAEGHALTPLTLGPIFLNEEPVNGLTVTQYFGRLLASAATTHGIPEYGRVIRDFARRRQTCEVALAIQQRAGDAASDIAHVAAIGIDGLDAILSASRAEKPTCHWIGDSAIDLLANIIDGKGEKPVSTGLTDLDHVIGGFYRREFTVIAGRPSMGKSAMLLALMLNAARAGTDVMFFSLEMTQREIAARCLSEAVWIDKPAIPYANILKNRGSSATGQLGSDELNRLNHAAEEFHDLPIKIEDQRGLTSAEIAARSRAHANQIAKNGKSLGLVIADHLGIIRASDRYAGNKVHETGEKSGALATLAKDLNVGMVAAHQLNRGTEGRE